MRIINVRRRLIRCHHFPLTRLLLVDFDNYEGQIPRPVHNNAIPRARSLQCAEDLRMTAVFFENEEGNSITRKLRR